MEVAGGAIGAVALGIQLVGTVQKVTSFIRSIQDAPKHLARLGSSVAQLESILNRVTNLIESLGQQMILMAQETFWNRRSNNASPTLLS